MGCPCFPDSGLCTEDGLVLGCDELEEVVPVVGVLGAPRAHELGLFLLVPLCKSGSLEVLNGASGGVSEVFEGLSSIGEGLLEVGLARRVSIFQLGPRRFDFGFKCQASTLFGCICGSFLFGYYLRPDLV